MGIFNLFKKSKQEEQPKTKAEKKTIFECIQGGNFRGYKKAHLTVYNDNDLTNYNNAEILYKKYGEYFKGAQLRADLIPLSNNESMILLFADGLQVGAIFQTNEIYEKFIKSEIENIFLKAGTETAADNITDLHKAVMLVKCKTD